MIHEKMSISTRSLPRGEPVVGVSSEDDPPGVGVALTDVTERLTTHVTSPVVVVRVLHGERVAAVQHHAADLCLCSHIIH